MPQLLLMVLAASSLDGAFRIEPVGWSADERKVALRVFSEPTRTEREGPEEPLTTSKWKETFTAPGAATLTVENQTVCGVMSCTITATCAWTVSGAKRFSGKTKRSRPYDTMGAGNVSFVLEPVLVSPSKQVVLAFFQERFTSMRTADFSTRLLWPAK